MQAYGGREVIAMRDDRIDRLAEVLVNYSVRCGKGDKVLIEGRGVGPELVNACIGKVFAAGAIRAAKWICGKPAGLYDMKALLSDL